MTLGTRVFYVATMFASVAPVVSGTLQEGETLSCTPGTWKLTEGTVAFAYQWTRDGVDIVGATSSTYDLVSADVGAEITCRVIATDDVESATSESLAHGPITVVAPAASGALEDQVWVEGVAIGDLDVSVDFSGGDLTFALAPSSGAMSAGCSLSSAGIIFGTPTVTAAQVNLVIRATNSAGYDDSAFGVTVINVPDQMAAPTLTATSNSIIGVDRAADPADNYGAITDFDLRHSTNDATWTEAVMASDPQSVSGLTASTLYYVQTRAANAAGNGAWSASATVTTNAGPSPTDTFVFTSSLPASFDVDRATGGHYWTSGGVLTFAGVDVARIDHDPDNGNAALGLLVEEATTNIWPYSEELNHAAVIASNVAVTANDHIAPDGTTTADHVNPGGGTTRLELVITVAAETDHVASWWVLEDQTGGGDMRIYDNSNGANVLLATVPMSSDWTRNQFAFTTPAGCTSIRVSIEYKGYKDHWAWGVQLEPGDTATSYIKTTSASQTRQADTLSINTDKGAKDVRLTYGDDTTEDFGNETVNTGWSPTIAAGKTHIKQIELYAVGDLV